MKILIVDDESDICEIVEFLIQGIFPEGTQTTIASSGNQAIKILSENMDIDICICDHNMPDGMGNVVSRFLMDVKSGVKFVLCSTVVPQDRPQDYPADFVYFNLQKPNITDGLEKLLLRLEKSFPAKAIATAEEFIPVTLNVLTLIGKAPADIFIRMSENKFIKCINQFEEFSTSDKEKYKQKMIDELYIKRDDQENSLKEIICTAIQEIMDRRKLPLSERMSMTHSQLIGLIKFTGLTPDLIEASKKNIEQSVNFIMKSPLVSDFWKDMNLLGDYPSNLYTLHSMLSSVVTKKLLWSSEATMFKLTLAAFLQDISLNSVALMELCDYQEFLENESRFTRDEIKRYREHPQVSSEISRDFKEIPPDIDRILIEQHEMPDGSGFPRKLNANQLGPLTCAFILTGIFARHILRDGSSFDVITFANDMEKRGYSRGNFKETFNIIKKYGQP